MLSLVIPVRNEQENVVNLAQRITVALKHIPHEILYMDSSTDDTSYFLSKAAEQFPTVNYIFAPELNLAGKVVLGMRLSKGNVIAVMDSDLQHPPEILPDMLSAIQRGTDLVVPSRLIEGGSEEGLSPFRQFTSWAARMAGKSVLKRVREVSDPTSGFFMLKRHVVDGVDLNPIGWKILMEILVKGKHRTIQEIPYTFEKRKYGRSKFNWREQWNYVRHIGSLMKYDREAIRPLLFGVVGLSGTLINLLAFTTFNALNFPVLVSASLATGLATVTNFALNNTLTWGDQKYGRWMIRGMKYIISSSISLMLNLLVLALLDPYIGHIASDLAGIATAMVLNYVVNNHWTWARKNNPSLEASK